VPTNSETGDGRTVNTLRIVAPLSPILPPLGRLIPPFLTNPGITVQQ